MHDYIEINTESKDIWLQCMTLAIDTMDMEAGIKAKLMNHFTSVAERLVNQAE
jgi:truncated hemoglobin YjbI